MTRLTFAALVAIGLVFPLLRRGTVAQGPPARTDGRDRADSGLDPRSLPLLRQHEIQERLGLTADQKVEIGRLLALTLDPDQDDLIRLILGQYRADRGRLRELQDPRFDDDDDDRRDEMARLGSMSATFPIRAAALVDRVLTPSQRAALADRPCPSDPDALSGRLSDLQRSSLRGIAAALTRPQHDQLMQMTLKSEGALAAARPEVSAGLDLSPDRRERIRAIWESARVSLDHLRDPSPVSPAYRRGDDLEAWMKPRLPAIRTESARIVAAAAERIGRVLDEAHLKLDR